MRRHEAKSVAVPAVDAAKLGVADPYSFLQHDRKHRIDIAGRAADDLEHLRCRRLLLQRLGESRALRCCSASNSRVFSIAITAWSAKVSTSSICLSVNGRTAAALQDEARQLAPPLAEAAPRGLCESRRVSAISRKVYSGSAKNIRNLNGFALQQYSADYTAASRCK